MDGEVKAGLCHGVQQVHQRSGWDGKTPSGGISDCRQESSNG